jgi:hypothetical protein
MFVGWMEEQEKRKIGRRADNTVGSKTKTQTLAEWNERGTIDADNASAKASTT